MWRLILMEWQKGRTIFRVNCCFVMLFFGIKTSFDAIISALIGSGCEWQRQHSITVVAYICLVLNLEYSYFQMLSYFLKGNSIADYFLNMSLSCDSYTRSMAKLTTLFLCALIFFFFLIQCFSTVEDNFTKRN